MRDGVGRLRHCQGWLQSPARVRPTVATCALPPSRSMDKAQRRGIRGPFSTTPTCSRITFRRWRHPNSLWSRISKRNPENRSDAAILSESVARMLWPGQNPVGRQHSSGNRRKVPREGRACSRWAQPSGDRCRSRNTRCLDRWRRLQQIYLPMPEDRVQDYSIMIRTQGDPVHLVNVLGPVISSVDPEIVATSVTLEELLASPRRSWPRSLSAGVASAVGLLGLLLAYHGHLRNSQLYGCHAHARSRHPHGSGR